MKGYQAPITEENLQVVSDSILKLCRKNAGKDRAFNVVLPLSTVLFGFLALIFTYGAIYSISTADDAVVFEKFKPITAIWQFFTNLLLQEGAPWYINIPIFLIALLLIPMAISAIVSILLRLTTKMPEISPEVLSLKEKARFLYEAIPTTHKVINFDYGVFSLWCAGVYTALMLAFTIYSMVLTFDYSDLSNLISIVIGMLVAFTAAFFAFAYLFMLSYFLNTCLCTSKSLYKHKTDVYEFLCTLDPEEAKRREEKKKQDEAKKRAAEQAALDIYKDTAYYKERKAETMRNIDKYVYGYSYSDYKLTGIHLDDKEALRQYLNSNAPDDVKQEAIKKYNDYHLDNFMG